jgi:hypothetical protein
MDNNGSQTAGLLETVLSPGETTRMRPAGALSLEERSAWFRRLGALADRNGRELWAWKAELETMLEGQPLFAGLSKQIDRLKLPESDPPSVQEASDFALKLRRFVDTAIRSVEAQPVRFIGDDLEGQIHDVVRVSLMRQVRWWIPIAATLLCGGTIFGTLQVKGVIDRANQSIQEVQAKLKEAEAVIDGARTTATNQKISVEKDAAAFKATMQDRQAEAGKLVETASQIIATAQARVTASDGQIATLGKALDALADRQKIAQSQILGLSAKSDLIQKTMDGATSQLAGFVEASKRLTALPSSEVMPVVTAALAIAPLLGPLVPVAVVLSILATAIALFAALRKRARRTDIIDA